MANIDKQPSKEVQTLQNEVGLSYSPYLTAKRIYIKRYVTGETLITGFPKPKPEYKAKKKPTPPLNTGQRVQSGLSKRGKSKLRRAASFYQTLVDKSKTEKAYSSMITLSYGKEYPDDKTSKKDLDNFFKRLRRRVGSNFHYFWVAERQKRGAIHYHIVTPEYVPKEWINKHWNAVVNNRMKKEGKKTQTLFPNVIAVLHAGAYVTKYLQKEGENIIGNGYFLSQKTSESVKPTFQQCYDVTHEEEEGIYWQGEGLKKGAGYAFTFTQPEDRFLHWINKTNDYAFKEFIDSLKGKESLTRLEQWQEVENLPPIH